MDSTAAYAQWQTQLAAMRAAVADLKLPVPTGDSYGSYIDFDEDFTSGNSGDDVWDFISDSEEDVWSSDANEPPPDVEAFGPGWLHSKCSEFASRKQGLSGDDLQEQIGALLVSDSAEEELQSTLTDIIGFDDLDFVIELISHRKEITKPASSVRGAAATDGLFAGKLQTRREREEALRQRDFEHKNAQLGPSRFSAGPTYPHVYTTHVAGNKLDSKGRQYGLPAGHTRKEERFYEEYTIPAGKVGTLGQGRKLVEISEMDGLCRNTFKGYKNLNRMQSLVYPVAYQTSENMLICAPTGAVSTLLPYSNIMLTVIG